MTKEWTTKMSTSTADSKFVKWRVGSPKVVYTTEVYAVSYSFRTVVLTSPLESIKKKEGGERNKAMISVCDPRQLFDKYMYLVGGPAGASTLFPGNQVAYV